MPNAKQYAALPFTVDAGRVRVLLITSRETGRWIIPKGWPKRNVEPHRLAALEAYEEAGLRGKISKKSLGKFTYQKLMDDGSKVQCDVIVYPLLVERQVNEWPEKGDRNCKWVKLSKAVDIVDDEGLADLLQRFRPEDSKLKKSA